MPSRNPHRQSWCRTSCVWLDPGSTALYRFGKLWPYSMLEHGCASCPRRHLLLCRYHVPLPHHRLLAQDAQQVVLPCVVLRCPHLQLALHVRNQVVLARRGAPLHSQLGSRALVILQLHLQRRSPRFRRNLELLRLVNLSISLCPC